MNKKYFLLLIDEICDVDPGTINDDFSLNNFDSIAILGLIAMLDKKFGLNFSMDDLKNFDTVGNLFDKTINKSLR